MRSGSIALFALIHSFPFLVQKRGGLIGTNPDLQNFDRGETINSIPGFWFLVWKLSRYTFLSRFSFESSAADSNEFESSQV